MKTLTTSFLAGLLLAGVSAHAQLVTYTFAGDSDAGSGIDPNATISSLGNGGSFGANPASNGWSSFGSNVNNAPAAASFPTRYVRSSVLTTSAGAADTAGDYFTFSISPNSGYEANLTTFTFDYALSAANDAISGPGSQTAYFFLRSDASGSFADVGSEVSETRTTVASSSPTYSRASISLSGSEFQNITSGDTVNFELYLYSDYIDSAGILRLDNLTLNGAVSAIPEPSTFALLAGVFALCSVMLRRRRA